MPFWNYYVKPSRLLPLQEVSESPCIRIWISQSTSLDRVICIQKTPDNTLNGELVIFGNTVRKKKLVYQYKIDKVQPVSGYSSFVKKISEIDVSIFKKLPEAELTLHQPYRFCLVEFMLDSKYNSFKFQLEANPKNKDVKNFIDFLKSEFPEMDFRG